MGGNLVADKTLHKLRKATTSRDDICYNYHVLLVEQGKGCTIQSLSVDQREQRQSKNSHNNETKRKKSRKKALDHLVLCHWLNDVLAAIIRESNGDVNEFVLSKASTLRGRKQARHSEFENIKNFKNSTNGEFVTIHWDEKLLKQSGDVQQTPNITVFSSNGRDSKLLGTTGLRRGTGLQQAEAIKELLYEWDLTDSCVAMCFDTTAANTGRFGGACTL